MNCSPFYGTRGNSDQKERTDLLKRFIRLFGLQAIEFITADREFIGARWWQFLIEHKRSFFIRMRDNMKITLPHKGEVKAFWLFNNLPLNVAYQYPKSVQVKACSVYLSGLKYLNKMEFSFTSKNDLLSALGFIGVAEPIIQALDQRIKVVAVKSNQLLVAQGQVNTHLYYVLNGGFACRYISDTDEVEKAINFYLNEFHPIMACLDSFFSGKKTLCELRAITNSTVLSIAKKDLDLLIEKDESLKTLFDALLIRALVEENELKLKIIAYKPETFYTYILKEMPVLVQKVPSKYIAELMGISAEWLSKLKAKQK